MICCVKDVQHNIQSKIFFFENNFFIISYVWEENTGKNALNYVDKYIISFVYLPKNLVYWRHCQKTSKYYQIEYLM